MVDVEDSVSCYSSVFRAGIDPATIRDTLARCLTDDVIVVHPQAGVLRGIDAVTGFAVAFHAGSDGASVVATTGVDGHHGRGRFGWAIEAADGARVADGVDFVEFTDDGRIATIAIFPDPLPVVG